MWIMWDSRGTMHIAIECPREPLDFAACSPGGSSILQYMVLGDNLNGDGLKCDSRHPLKFPIKPFLIYIYI